MSLDLSPAEREMLAGDHGPGVAMAMRIVVGLAHVREAARLLDVTSAHIDSCLYHGRAGLDFVTRLREQGARVAVPTTLNVGSLDLVHPGLVHADEARFPDIHTAGRELMQTYVALGARATFTCAPYQVDARPRLGEHVAWAESNAIVFANSVLGARTDRYGDFFDICAAITGKAPAAGLHLDANRRAVLVVDCGGLSIRWFTDELGYALVGYLVGLRSGDDIPALTGLPEGTNEDQLKSLGATAASAGSVALFHAVGLTPEAPHLGAVAARSAERLTLTDDDLSSARRELSTASTDQLDAVSVGTPHASLAELRALAEALDGRHVADGCELFVSTGRGVQQLAEQAGYTATIEAAGGTIVLDTCTYVTPVLRANTRTAMTNSGKWAHYAPANLGIDVTLASLGECVQSAVAGRRVLDDGTRP